MSSSEFASGTMTASTKEVAWVAHAHIQVFGEYEKGCKSGGKRQFTPNLPPNVFLWRKMFTQLLTFLFQVLNFVIQLTAGN